MTKFITKISAPIVQGKRYLRLSLPNTYAGRRLGCIAYGSQVTVSFDKEDGVKVNASTPPNSKTAHCILFSAKRIKGLEGDPVGKMTQEVEVNAKGEFTVDLKEIMKKESTGGGTVITPPPEPVKLESGHSFTPGEVVNDKQNARKAKDFLNKFAAENGYEFIVLGGKLWLEKRDVL